MLNLIGWIIKASIFAAIILVLGNWLQWKGNTLSDHVRSGMAQVEKKLDLPDLKNQVKEKIRREVSEDESPILESKITANRKKLERLKNQAARDGISDTERARMRQLIRELE